MQFQFYFINFVGMGSHLWKSEIVNFLFWNLMKWLKCFLRFDFFFAMMRWSRYRWHSTSHWRLQCDLEFHPPPSVLSRFLALFWTAEYRERVTIIHMHSNTQFVTVSNTNKPFAIETSGAETTGGTAYSPILKFVEYLKEYDIQNTVSLIQP